MRRLTRFVLATIAALSALNASRAVAAPESAPHAAACVAALEAEETLMAQAVKRGGAVGDDFLKVVRSGIAIIGTQYLAGLRESEARQLLKSAQEEFQGLPPAAASERQAACLREGEDLFQHASSLEKSLITTAAQHRIRRITAP